MNNISFFWGIDSRRQLHFPSTRRRCHGFLCPPPAATTAGGWRNPGFVSHRGSEFFVSGEVGEAAAMRIMVHRLSPCRWPSSEGRRWCRSLGIRSGVISVCPRSRCPAKGTTLRWVFVLQFYLRLMKLTQIRLCLGTCEVCVPLLCLARVGIIDTSQTYLYFFIVSCYYIIIFIYFYSNLYYFYELTY
jgi:hypothetical protein